MSADSPLFAPAPVAPEHRSPPVIVIGLPRSGSSFLSHVMSCIDDWYVFDDLYVRRNARAMGAQGPLDGTQLTELVSFLCGQLRARIKWEGDFPRPHCSLDDVDRMEAALLECFRSVPVTWPELTEEWLVRLALHHGRHRWGYKTPQDFLHLRELARAFPGVRFVFILRDPRRVMASFKFIGGEQGDPRQYHPLVYAHYWAMASRVVQRAERELGLPVHYVRFEALVAEPSREAAKIARFLGATAAPEIPPMGANTSFAADERRSVTPLESWLCERLAGSEMRRWGYEPARLRPRLADLPDVAATTAKFTLYQLRRALTGGAARESMRSFVRASLGRRG